MDHLLDGDVNKSVLFKVKDERKAQEVFDLADYERSEELRKAKSRSKKNHSRFTLLRCRRPGNTVSNALISSVHLLKCKCSYFADVLHDIVLFIATVVLFLCSPSSIFCNNSVPPDSHCHVIGGVSPTSVSGLVDSIFMSSTLP